MNPHISDPSFGPMEFNYGWCKDEAFILFGKPHTLEVLAEADTPQPIFPTQQQFYTAFKQERETLCLQAISVLEHYYIENLPAIGVQVEDPQQLPEEEDLTHADLIQMITPKTLFFPQDDFYALLCDCIWEPVNGLAFVISAEGITISTQDEIL